MLLQESQSKLVKLPTWRRRVLLLAMLFAFLLLAGRSFYLQLMNDDFLQKKGEAIARRKVILMPLRGKILDRNHELLAISSPVASMWLSPQDANMNWAQKRYLSETLGIHIQDINKKIARTSKEFVYLKRRIPPQLAQQILAKKIPGVYSQKEYKRFYPAGVAAAHVVGFTGLDDVGREGIEVAKNEYLTGKIGKRDFIKDRRGHVVEDLETIRMPQDGRDVVLSIDRRIQYFVYRELARAVEQHKAKAGAAVVLDANTGEVLAMVNLPTYNPNNPVNLRGKTRNSAIVNVYEPGSTMKPIAVATAMEVGNYTPNSKIQTAPGVMHIGLATVHDAHPLGMLTVAQVVQKSSNVGAAKMALSIPKKELWTKFVQLGFGARAKIGFPGEASGTVRDYKEWHRIEQATMSYGHGISVTLLQMARAYTVFANEGELKPVSLFKLDDVPVGRQVYSAKVANAVKDMLELVVQPGGTALAARVSGYRVAGKTGTAHKLNPSGGYEKDKYVSSFVGMIPASKPRLIMAVMIDEPSNGQYYGGAVAAPVFSKVMGEAMRTLVVPQDGQEIPANTVGMESVKESI